MLERVKKLPQVRLIMMEIGAWRDLIRWLRGIELVPDGAVAVDSHEGRYVLPAAMSVACVIEAGVLHLLLENPVIRIIALVVSVYALVMLWAYLAGTWIRPHYIVNGELVLRKGTKELCRGRGVARRERTYAARNHDFEEHSLVLGGAAGTNVTVEFSKPVLARQDEWPFQRKPLRSVNEVKFHADNPDAVVAAMPKAHATS